VKDFWAVRDVSFEVERGEALGIIGHNGAGKSTILKLLSSITAPTSGEITINGRLSALIEVGSGFHPELTGRENVYLNGSILGMSRREISEKMESIIEFAGISQFADTPVKRFSSGMYVRLGFSIAAHLEPDILLLDEVLAVGDAAFQAKCLERIGELKREGTTIVFISHDLGAVERLCDRVLLMKSGQVVASGPAREVIDTYQSAAGEAGGARTSAALAGSDAASLGGLSFYDAAGQPRPVFRTGEPLMARVEFEARAPIEDAVFDVLFHSADGVVHCEFTTEASGGRLSLGPGRGVVEFFCPELGLLPGIYYTDVAVKERGAVESIHFLGQSTTLRVDIGKTVRGNFYAPHQWCLRQTEGASEADVVSSRGN
jgi:ABC-type polysaccharide/polyol phosphate transport system ATPase subunit